MTLETQTPRVVIIGNGTRGPYSLVDASAQAIRLVSTSHLKLTRYASSTADNDAGTVLVENTDYTVGGTQDARTFTLDAGQAVLTSSQRILAERVQTYTQDLDLTTGGAFSATALETRFDKIAEVQQELKAQLARAPKLQFADATADVAFPSPPTSGAAFLIRNTDGSIGHTDDADLLAVADITAAIEQVAAIDAEVVIVADAMADVELVADNIADVNTVADTINGAGLTTGTGAFVRATSPTLVTPALGTPASGNLMNLKVTRNCATYAEMTALTAGTGLIDNGVYCTYGRAAEEDGGFGFWRYDSGSSATANAGTILAIDGGGVGRFFRLYDGEVDVRWFGAKLDGATDDSAALTSAIAAGREVYIPPGVLYLTTHALISSTDNWSLRGAGKGLTTIRCASGSTFTNSPLALSACDKVRISHITFDQNNNASLSATRPVVIVTGGTDAVVTDCEFIKLTYIGLAVTDTVGFLIENNYCSFDTALNTTNYGINVGSSGSISSNGRVIGNVCSKCTIIVSGYDIEVAGNMCFDYKYGAGIVTSGGNDTASYGQYKVHHNTCTDGSGVDSDTVDVAGIELGGYYNICNANICSRNGGVGIASLSPRSKITNNICSGNGQNAGATDANRAGIKLGFVDATIGAHNSLLSGNKCFDDGSTRQLYGIYEEGGATLSGVTMIANKLSGNGTAAVYLQGSYGLYYLDEWLDWTPTVTAQTGTITTVGTVTAKYLRRGPIVYIALSITITTNGTGGTTVRATTPIAAVVAGVAHGRENGITGNALHGTISLGNSINAQNYDATYPGADGAVINMAGFYGI